MREGDDEEGVIKGEYEEGFMKVSEREKNQPSSDDTYQSVTVADGDGRVLHVQHLSCVKAVRGLYWLRVFLS